MAEEIFEMDEAAQEFHEEQEQYKYIAFISYRHLPVDIRVAKAIHTMIETFKLPKEFDADGQQPKFRVFRDREELSTSSLSESIQDALKHSKFLIVVCSKRFNDSAWCQIEVETFIKLHGIHRVIPVLIEGEPEESFPKTLLPDGSAGPSSEGDAKDILAAELRSPQVKSPDFPGFASLEKTNPDQVHKLAALAIKCLKEEKYRIMAAILGVSYGDLKQRDKVRKQRQLILLSSIVSASLLFFGIFMLNAYRSENAAKRQTMQDKAYFMLTEANNLIKEGNRYKALILAENAMQDIDSKMSAYDDLKEQHLHILNETVAGSQMGYNRVIETGNEFTFLDINPKNQTFVAGLNNDSIALYDIQTGNLLKTASGHSQQVKILTFSNQGDQLVSGGFDDVINLWQADNLQLLASKKAPGNIMLAVYSNEDKNLEVIYDTSEGYIYQRYDSKTLDEIGASMPLRSNVRRVTFDKKGQFMWVLYDTYVENQSLIKYDLEKRTEALAFQDKVIDGQRYAYADMRGSEDHRYIYTRAGGGLLKIDMETDKILFQNDHLFKTALNEGTMASSDDGKFLYIVDSLNIRKLDSKTGKDILEISTGSVRIKQMEVSKDGQSLLALKENGDLLFIRNDKVVSTIPNTGKAGLDYIFMTPDGKNALALSLQNQEIKLLNLPSSGEKEVEDGQLVTASNNGHYGLLYQEGQFFLLDANRKKIVKEIKPGILSQNASFIPSYAGYVLSNNGRYLTTPLTSEDGQNKIGILDTENDKNHMTIIIDRTSYRMGFSPDSSQLFVTTANGQITFYDLKKKKQASQLNIDKGGLANIFVSADGGYFVAQYTEAISKVYDLKTRQKVADIPGAIVSMDKEEDGKTRIFSLYNNIGSSYHDFKKTGTDINFSNQLDQLGESGKFQHDFHAEKQLLLTIRVQGDAYYAYLINFKTGKLMQQFAFHSSAYPMNGFISEDGRHIYVDNYYAHNIREEEQYQFYSTYRHFTLQDYDTLLKKSQDTTREIQLSEEEKKDLNMAD